jgi:integrase
MAQWSWYVRVGKGPRIRLRAEFGTPEFTAQYLAALKAGTPVRPTKTPKGTIAWLVETFQASPQWKALASETRKQFGIQYRRIVEANGHLSIAGLGRRDILDGRDRRAQVPSDANKFVKATRKLFEFAVEREWLKSNPTAGVKLLAYENPHGFHTWTIEECERFEAHWPIGTRERLAFDILLYTGLRRGDAVALGPKHVRNRVLTITTSKTGEEVVIPVLPPLQRSIAASKIGKDTFIATTRGTPFDKASFGTWFRKACDTASVPGSAHGLRKAGAVRAAESGATEAQMNAWFGWAEGSRESATYIKRARRAKMADATAKLLMTGRDDDEKS